MRKAIISLVGVAFSVVMLVATNGCGDDVQSTEAITIHEQEPVRMVSPGEPVVE